MANELPNNLSYLTDEARAIVEGRRVGSFDGGGGGGYDGRMEARITRLEADLTAIKIDVAVIKANGATKADLAEVKGGLKADIAEAKVSIIMWVVSAIFLAQLLPSLVKLFIK